ncbi:MAG: hypothetical protein ACRD3F_12600 [Acidobacteriaceae bacterium]
MSIRQLVWGVALAAALPVTLVAQQAPIHFYSVACVKIKPGKTAAFNTLVSTLQKYEQSRVDSGAASAVIQTRAVSPAGASAACDYEFVTFYSGLPPAPMSKDEMTAALQKAGISSSPEELRQQEDAVGYLASYSIVRQALGVGNGVKKGDYVVVNDMKVPDTGAWIENEKKLWQPIFEDGVKDGSMAAWAVNVSWMPRGAKDPYTTYTVDVYSSWQSLFSFFGPSFPARWKRINPDVPMAQGMDQEHKVDTIEHTTLSKVVFVTQAAK